METKYDMGRLVFRWTVLAVIVTLVILFFTSCSGSDPGPDPVPVPSTTITIPTDLEVGESCCDKCRDLCDKVGCGSAECSACHFGCFVDSPNVGCKVCSGEGTPCDNLTSEPALPANCPLATYQCETKCPEGDEACVAAQQLACGIASHPPCNEIVPARPGEVGYSGSNGDTPDAGDDINTALEGATTAVVQFEGVVIVQRNGQQSPEHIRKFINAVMADTITYLHQAEAQNDKGDNLAAIGALQLALTSNRNAAWVVTGGIQDGSIETGNGHAAKTVDQLNATTKGIEDALSELQP